MADLLEQFRLWIEQVILTLGYPGIAHRSLLPRRVRVVMDADTLTIWLDSALAPAETHWARAAVGREFVRRYSFPEKFCPTSSSARMGQNFSG